MVSIHDVLGLDLFQGAELVGGGGGTHREIRWVHIVSMPEDETYDWTRGGELVLGVGYQLTDDAARQTSIIQELHARNIVGLVISLGHYLDDIPEAMRDAANALDFPIITLPGNVLFVDVTEAIFKTILDEKYAHERESQYIHDMLTRVVLEGGTLQNLVDTLAVYLNKSITIETTNFMILADAHIGPVDEARRNSVDEGRSTPELVRRLHEENVYERLLANRRPERIPPDPSIGMDMERIIAPIIVAKKIIGYVWIIGDQTRLSPLDDLAIERAATVAALFMYKEQAVYENQMSLRGNFLSLLLTADDTPDAQLESKANNIGFKLDRRYQVIVLRRSDPSTTLEPTLPQQVESYLEETGGGLVVLQDRQIIIVLQTLNPPEGRRIAEGLLGWLGGGQARLVAGVGNPVESPGDVSASFEQAREALVVAQTLELRQTVLAFEDLGLLHWLQHIPDETLTENRYYRSVQDLYLKDNRKNKELLVSLEAYLKHGGNIKEAAAELFIHRNTLIYRLERVEATTELDLKDPDVQLNLAVALRSFRLRGSGRLYR